VTVAAAARELAVDRATIYRLIDGGQLPGVRFGAGAGRGKLLRIRAQDLERFIAERETKSCPAQ
jgi:excisionase family DNA binding protein